MKKLRAILVVLMIGMFFYAGLTYAGSEVQHSGFLEDYSQLKPGPKHGADEVYIKDGIDFSQYDSIMVDHVLFYLKKDAQDKGINADEMKELADEFHKALVEAVGSSYTLVNQAGPNVMRIRTAITNLEPNKRIVSGVTTIVPVGLALSVVKKGVTGEHTGVGETGMEIEFLDSQTNERLVAAVDEHPGGKLKGMTKWGSASDAFKFWAKTLRTRLEQVRSGQVKDMEDLMEH